MNRGRTNTKRSVKGKKKKSRQTFSGPAPARTQGSNPLRFTTEKLVSPIPDQTIVSLKYSALPEVLFNSIASFNQGLYYMNSMKESKAARTMTLDYLSAFDIMYTRYRVIKSRVRWTFSNREPTYSEVLLVPTTANSSAGTQAQWEIMASLPNARKISLAPIGSGGCCKSITTTFNPEKFVGPQYNVQDEYSAATNSLANPATLLYWNLNVYNTSAFTVAGGIVVTVQYLQTVKFYEVDRDNSSTVLKVKSTPESIDSAIEQLYATRAKLVRTTSLERAQKAVV